MPPSHPFHHQAIEPESAAGLISKIPISIFDFQPTYTNTEFPVIKILILVLQPERIAIEHFFINSTADVSIFQRG